MVVSRDNYMDLVQVRAVAAPLQERAEWREVVAHRLVMPTFVGDLLMMPEDPRGRGGPSLDQFLAF